MKVRPSITLASVQLMFECIAEQSAEDKLEALKGGCGIRTAAARSQKNQGAGMAESKQGAKSTRRRRQARSNECLLLRARKSRLEQALASALAREPSAGPGR